MKAYFGDPTETTEYLEDIGDDDSDDENIG